MTPRGLLRYTSTVQAPLPFSPDDFATAFAGMITSRIKPQVDPVRPCSLSAPLSPRRVIGDLAGMVHRGGIGDPIMMLGDIFQCRRPA